MMGTGDHLNIRRPMQWTDAVNAGFSTTTPWQSPGANFQMNNVEEMGTDSNSLLNHYRKLIQIRNKQESLRRGHTLIVQDNESDVFSFVRFMDEQAIISVANTGTVTVNP